MAYGYGQFRDWVDLEEELRPGLYDEQRQMLRGGGLPAVVRFDEDPTGVSGLPVGRTAAQEVAMAAEAAAIEGQVAQRRAAGGGGRTVTANPRQFNPPASAAPIQKINITRNGKVVGTTYQAVELPESGIPAEARPAKAAPKQTLVWANGEELQAPKPKIQPPKSAIERHMAKERVLGTPGWARKDPPSRITVNRQAPQPIEATQAAEMALAEFIAKRQRGETAAGASPAENSYVSAGIGDMSDPGATTILDVFGEDQQRREWKAKVLAERAARAIGLEQMERERGLNTPTTPRRERLMAQSMNQAPTMPPSEMAKYLVDQGLAVTSPGIAAERQARAAAADLGNRPATSDQVNDLAYAYDEEGGGRKVVMQIGQPVTDPITIQGAITPTNLWPSEPGVRVEALQGGDPSYMDDEVRMAGDGRGGPGLVPVATVDAQGRRRTRLIDPNAETSLPVPGFDYGVEGSPSARTATVGDFARGTRTALSTPLVAGSVLGERLNARAFHPSPAYLDLRGWSDNPSVSAPLSWQETGDGRQIASSSVQAPFLPGLEEFAPAQPLPDHLRTVGGPLAKNRNFMGYLNGQPVFLPDGGGVTVERVLVDPNDPERNRGVVVPESGYRIGTKYPHREGLHEAIAAIAEDQGLPVIRGIGPAVGEQRLRPERMQALTGNPAITLTDARTGQEIGRSFPWIKAIQGEVLARLRDRATPLRASWQGTKGPQSMNIVPDQFAIEQSGGTAPIQYLIGEADRARGEARTVVAGVVPAITNPRIASWERGVVKRNPGLGESEAGKTMALLASGSSLRSLPTVSGGALERAVDVVDPETLRASLAASKQAEMNSFQARIQGVRDEGQERFKEVRREAQARLQAALTMALNRARGR